MCMFIYGKEASISLDCKYFGIARFGGLRGKERIGKRGVLPGYKPVREMCEYM